LSDCEEDQLFKHIRADLHDVVRFLLGTGWRRSEVFNLKGTSKNGDFGLKQAA